MDMPACPLPVASSPRPARTASRPARRTALVLAAALALPLPAPAQEAGPGAPREPGATQGPGTPPTPPPATEDAPAGDEAGMSAAEFDAYTRGRTFHYAEGGTPYGIEEYLPGQRVRWSYLGGECRAGRWYAQDGAICFVYEDNPVPQCWAFRRGASGLTARFLGESDTLLYEMRSTDTPMDCAGPYTGV